MTHRVRITAGLTEAAASGLLLAFNGSAAGRTTGGKAAPETGLREYGLALVETVTAFHAADGLNRGPGQGRDLVDDGLEDDVLVRLREAFCDEVLSQDCAQRRLRRVVVLRWARFWYGQAAITAPPDGLQLPALDED